MGIKTDSIDENPIVISEEGLIRNVNAAACGTLGYEIDELIGQPVKIIFSKNEPLINNSGFSLIREAEFYKEWGYYIKAARSYPFGLPLHRVVE